MLHRRHVRAAGSATLLASLLGLSACGGLSEGDYVFYRVAFQEARLAASCFPNDMIPASEKDDSTTFLNGTTFILYVAAEDQALLDIDGLVLTGSVDGEPYTFSGVEKDVDTPPGNVIIDSDHDGIDDSQDTMVDADMDGLDDGGADTDVDVDNDGLDDRFADDIVDQNNDGVDDRITEIPSDTKFVSSVSVDIEMTVDGSTAVGTATRKTKETCTGMGCPTDTETSCTVTQEFKGVEIEEPSVDVGGGGIQGP